MNRFHAKRLVGIRWLLPISLLVVICGCDEEALVTLPSEKEANRVLVALETRGIHTARKKEDKSDRRHIQWKIFVSEEQTARARQWLVRLDLPREEAPGFESLFQEKSLIPSKAQERARLMVATAGELSRTFEAFDRVIAARVHLVLPEERFGGDCDCSKATAAVLIKYVPLEDRQKKQSSPVQGHSDDGGELPEPAGDGDAPADADSEHGGEVAGSADAHPQTGDASGDDMPEPLDAPISSATVKDIVARSVPGLIHENVTVAYAVALRLSKSPGVGDSLGDDPPAAPVLTEERAIILLAVVVAEGVALIILILWLRRERQKRAEGGAA